MTCESKIVMGLLGIILSLARINNLTSHSYTLTMVVDLSNDKKVAYHSFILFFPTLNFIL